MTIYENYIVTEVVSPDGATSEIYVHMTPSDESSNEFPRVH